VIDLYQKLEALGDEANQVAASLAKLNIKGRRANHCECPLARYLAATYPDHKFEVSNTRVQIDGEGRSFVPFPCRMFVIEFDRGMYPDLVDAEGDARD
jgi:hypothetical protein